MADVLFSDSGARAARGDLLSALESAGYVVSEATSRAQLLAVASHAPELVLGLVAPAHLGADGPSLARAWRGAISHPGEGGPELHLLLEAPSPGLVERCLAAGADAVHDAGAPARVVVAWVDAARRRQLALRALRASCEDNLARRLVDAETDLFNQRYLRLRLREEVERCRRHPRELALMLLEFETVAVARGERGRAHAGSLLRELARRASASLRSYDLIARAGPSGLAVLLPDLPLAHAFGLGQRLLARLRAAPIAAGDEPPRTVRVRMGIAGAAGVDEELLAADVFQAARAATEDASDDAGPVLRRVVSLPAVLG